MENRNADLKEFVEGILSGKDEHICRLQVYFIGAMRSMYNDYIGVEFGNSDEDDIISISLKNLVGSMAAFRGNSWQEFRGYGYRVVKNTVLNYSRYLRRRKGNLVPSDSELAAGCFYRQYNRCESLEDRVINRMMYDYIIENANLSSGEREYNIIIEGYGSVEEYLRENEGNANALNQAGYRLRNKLKKKLLEFGLKSLKQV
ncbi:sigma-70 family RNA polymerase sigma factor [Clostridium sp. LBM24168]